MESELAQVLGKNTTVKNVKKLKNIMCGDFDFNGKNIMAYIIKKDLLENETEFTGKVVGLILFRDRQEERIILANKDSKITYYSEIKKYFDDFVELKDTKFRCINEKSAGAIIYKMIDREPRFLLVCSKKGFWGFPKGHIEAGEKEEDTAIREVKEEVGISIELKNGFKEKISYMVQEAPTHKEVVLFLSEISEKERTTIQEEELVECRFVKYEEARDLLSENARDALDKAKEYIEKK